MNCRACRSDRLDPVFEMDPMPLAGGFAATAEEARVMPRYPLTWLLCYDCGLVNVAPDIPDADIFATYSYAASTVPALVRHHAEFASVLRDRYRDPIHLLEIGGNDGVLLNQLPAHWDLWNVDPSDVAKKATGHYLLVNEAFGTGWQPQGFDVVVSSNAFAHFSDIAGALDSVARTLKPGGEFWIEVHDLDATLASGQWDTVYHEHKVEWSLESLAAAGNARGLQVNHLDRLPLHGGLLRMRFVKNGAGTTTDFPNRDFGRLRNAYIERIPRRVVAAYGAAARATVYLNQCDTGASYVVDGSPLRAGKFVPGLGIPVVPPTTFDVNPPETTLITAWNHADDIKARHPDYTGWVTAW